MFIDKLKIIEKEPQSHLNESSLNSLDIIIDILYYLLLYIF